MRSFKPYFTPIVFSNFLIGEHYFVIVYSSFCPKLGHFDFCKRVLNDNGAVRGLYLTDVCITADTSSVIIAVNWVLGGVYVGGKSGTTWRGGKTLLEFS